MQINSITIADGTSPTPVSHIFNPIANNPARYQRNGVAGQPVIAFEDITIKVQRAKTPNGANRVDLELQLPVLEVASGGTSSGLVAPPSIAHVLTARVQLFCHQRSTKEQRVDLRTLLKNLLADVQFTTAVDNLENAF